jgi:hypothetical protein
MSQLWFGCPRIRDVQTSKGNPTNFGAINKELWGGIVDFRGHERPQ